MQEGAANRECSRSGFRQCRRAKHRTGHKNVREKLDVRFAKSAHPPRAQGPGERINRFIGLNSADALRQFRRAAALGRVDATAKLTFKPQPRSKSASELSAQPNALPAARAVLFAGRRFHMSYRGIDRSLRLAP